MGKQIKDQRSVWEGGNICTESTHSTSLREITMLLLLLLRLLLLLYLLLWRRGQSRAVPRYGGDV